MDIATALLRVTSQRFIRIDTGHGTSAVIPLCSNPACNKPLKNFDLAMWATLEEGNSWETPELRAFCRNHKCDIFKAIEHETNHDLSSWWYELDQLWQRDQRHRFEKKA